jgi:hypothetical protein
MSTQLPTFTLPIHQLETRDSRLLVCNADVVLGKDTATGEIRAFFGTEASCHAENVKTLVVELDFGSDQINFLATMVTAFKGSCCYGNQVPSSVHAPASEVPFEDAQSEQIVSIPASEPAPGMMQTRIDGTDEEVWVKPLKRGAAKKGFRHPPFGPKRRQDMEFLRDTFLDVLPLTADQWEQSFREHPSCEREIHLWLFMALCFLRLTHEKQLALDERRDIYEVILATVRDGAEHITSTVNPVTLSTERVREIATYVAGAWLALTGDIMPVPAGRTSGTSTEARSEFGIQNEA